MTRVKIALAVLIVLLLGSCKITSGYTDYTWDGTSYTDADSDGIPDVAEADGTSFYGMPLYDWGARQGTPDLFIHVAPMKAGTDSNGYPDAGMLLQKKALDRVVSAFASQGIAVHFDVGKSRLYEGYTEITNRGVTSYNLSGKDHSVPYNDSIALYNYSGTDSSFTFVNALKTQYLPTERYQIFYFMVMGSSQNADGSGGSSGIAYSPGRDFLITMANWGFGFGTNASLELTYENFENYVVNNQASTIMHEFGHNLSLQHGGNESLNYKPNYYSIMNYLYQLRGLPRIGTNEGDRYYFEMYSLTSLDKWKNLITKKFDPYLYTFDLNDSSFSSTYRMDYSHGLGGNLSEVSLTDADGLKQSGSIAVDWDGNGLGTSSNYNINPSYDTTTNSVLSDYNDWGNLYFYYNANHAGAERTQTDTTLNIIREVNVPSPSIPVNRSY